MRGSGALVAAALLAHGPAGGVDERPALRFAWPVRGEAQVELTDERSVGEERRSIVMTMRLRVEPDGSTGRLVVRLSDARLVSIDGATPGKTDPAETLLAVGQVMKRVTPTMVVSPEGRFLATRDLDRLVGDVLVASGFPALPPGLASFAKLLDGVAAEDWRTWVGAWIGDRMGPGDRTQFDRELPINGTNVLVHMARRGLASSDPEALTRLEATVVYPSDAVRPYVAGFLIDMAREAKELGDEPGASERFLASAQYGPMTETITVELETATMRPRFAERSRTFSAVHGKHEVEGLERRAHRFTWVADGAAPASP